LSRGAAARERGASRRSAGPATDAPRALGASALVGLVAMMSLISGGWSVSLAD
jgi:hypothetical protein